MRQNSGRKIAGRTIRSDPAGVDSLACRLHLLPERTVVRIGIQLDSYEIHVVSAEINLNAKDQLIALAAYVQCAEANIVPLPRDLVLPGEKRRGQSRASRRAPRECDGGRQIFLLGVLGTVRFAENSGVNAAIFRGCAPPRIAECPTRRDFGIPGSLRFHIQRRAA